MNSPVMQQSTSLKHSRKAQDLQGPCAGLVGGVDFLKFIDRYIMWLVGELNF